MDSTAQPRIDGTSTAAYSGVELPPVGEIWARAFDRVRRVVDVPTVWLAMQAVTPLIVEGSYFVGALSADNQYLATNLKSGENSIAIEEALQQVTGRILAFRLIEGDSLADWEAEKAREATRTAGTRTAMPTKNAAGGIRDEQRPTAPRPQPAPVQETVSQQTFAAPRPQARPSNREVYPTWEKLYERLAQGYKSAPLVKYPHGQARYLLEAVRLISDTMDVMMPAPGLPRDDTQERMLAKTIERLGSIMSGLDSLFISLELLRYRESQGKDIGIAD